jgi:hypothetical protein
MDGLVEELRVVVVGSGSTVWLNGELVLLAKVGSPLYTAVSELVETASAEVVRVATPLLTLPVPRKVLPAKKVTNPVGVPVPLVGLTVAVNVTDCP